MAAIEAECAPVSSNLEALEIQAERLLEQIGAKLDRPEAEHTKTLLTMGLHFAVAEFEASLAKPRRGRPRNSLAANAIFLAAMERCRPRSGSDAKAAEAAALWLGTTKDRVEKGARALLENGVRLAHRLRSESTSLEIVASQVSHADAILTRLSAQMNEERKETEARRKASRFATFSRAVSPNKLH